MAARIPLTVNSSSLSLEELPSGIDLDITGSNLVSTSTTATLLNTGVSTLNIGGAATTLSLGASTGTTTVNNTLAAATTLVTADPLPIIGGLTSSTTDDNLDKGIRFRWATGGAAKTGFFGFADSDGKFKFIPDATITSNVVSGTLGTVAFGGIEGTTGSFSSTLSVTGNTTLTGDLAVNGGDITTTATGTATVFNTNATTLNIGGAATTVSIGAATGTLTINNANTVITGNLTVNGTTTTINSTTLSVDDILVELGTVATPTDTTAAGGGIVLKGATDKSITWGATNGWTSTEEFNLATGKQYKINGTSVLSATTLGSGVTASSLTSVGTIGTGTWQGSVVAGQYGGTGVNNSGKTITLGGNLTTSGAFATTLTVTAATNVTLPTTGTLATVAGTETLTNKTIAAGSNTISGLTNANLSGSAGITNANLANSSVTVGTTAISLGSSSTTLAGLTSVSSTSFTGALTGNASTATSLAGGSAGTIPYQTAAGTTAMLAAGTSGYFLKSNNTSAPSWVELSLTDLPDAWVKKSVRVATTANITLSGTQTIDGIAVVAGDRVLVKDQTTASQNGIYVVAAGAWSRATDANTISKLAGALVNVDSGTVGGGLRYDTDLKATDTLDTTAVSFYKAYDTNDAATANTATKLVLRDASGNFSAGTITAALSGNASTATTLQTARNINGVSFNGSADITITAAAGTLTGTALNSTVVSSSLTSVGTITSGTWSGSFGAVSGANLTSLTAGNLSGTIPSAVLGNSTHYIGTTAVALNRASANQALTGISSIALPGATSGTVTMTPAATAGTTAITIPATSGTLVTTGDSGTVTNTMLAGSIANAKLVNSTISGVALGSNLNTLTLNVSGTGLSGSTTYNGSAAATFTVTSNATNANTASTIVARDASGNFSAGAITASSFTETSDERLKSQIVPLTNALNIVTALEGKAFVKDGKASVGLIAQQVQRVLPQVVNASNDEMKTLSVQYGNIVAVLIEAIKEQQVQIDELKAKLGN